MASRVHCIGQGSAGQVGGDVRGAAQCLRTRSGSRKGERSGFHWRLSLGRHFSGDRPVLLDELFIR